MANAAIFLIVFGVTSFALGMMADLIDTFFEELRSLRDNFSPTRGPIQGYPNRFCTILAGCRWRSDDDCRVVGPRLKLKFGLPLHYSHVQHSSRSAFTRTRDGELSSPKLSSSEFYTGRVPPSKHHLTSSSCKQLLQEWELVYLSQTLRLIRVRRVFFFETTEKWFGIGFFYTKARGGPGRG